MTQKRKSKSSVRQPKPVTGSVCGSNEGLWKLPIGKKGLFDGYKKEKNPTPARGC